MVGDVIAKLAHQVMFTEVINRKFHSCNNGSPLSCWAHTLFDRQYQYSTGTEMHITKASLMSDFGISPQAVINYTKHLQVLVAWLIGDHLLLRDLGPYGIIFMNVHVVITVAMVMLLRDCGPYGIIFMSMFVYYFRFPHHS
jgi:hypothetical protein